MAGGDGEEGLESVQSATEAFDEWLRHANSLRSEDAAGKFEADKAGAASCKESVPSFQEGETSDVLCYVDPDAERWAALAELGGQCAPVPDVQKGNVRIQGTFQGTTTTHTHQMDMAVGVDLEMPSQVAANSLKQLAGSGFQLPEGAQEALMEAHPKKGLLGALANYFWQDSQDIAQADIPSLIMSGMQLKMGEIEAIYEEEKKQLVSELDAAKERAASLETHLTTIQEEQGGLKEQLEAAQPAAPSVEEQLHEQAHSLQSQFAAREAELQALAADLDAQVQATFARAQEASAGLEREAAARERLEQQLQEAQGSMAELCEENGRLRTELGDEKASSMGLAAQLQALQESTPEAASERIRDEDAEQAAAAQAEQLRALAAECTELRGRLAAAEAAQAAASDPRQLQDLEASMAQLAGREAEAQTLLKEASKAVAERTEEVEKLRAESRELRETLAKVTASERRLSATAAELNSRLLTSPAMSSRSLPMVDEKAGQASQQDAQVHQELQDMLKQHEDLQAEHEKALRCLDGLEGERSHAAAEMKQLREQSHELGRQLQEAKISLATETATKASLAAQANQEKENTARLKKELTKQREIVSEVGTKSSDLGSKVKELEQQLEQATAQQTRSSKLKDEISKLRSQVAFQEESSSEMKKQNKQALKDSAEALTQAKQWQLKCKEAQGQAEDLTKELQATKQALAGAAQRAEQATSDALERTNHESLARARIRDLEDMQVERLKQQLTEEEQQPGTGAAMSVSSEPRVLVRTAPLTTISTMPTAVATSPALPVASSASAGAPLSPSSGTATPQYKAYPVPSYGGQAPAGKKTGKITHVGTMIKTPDGRSVYHPTFASGVSVDVPAAGASVSTMPAAPVHPVAASVKVPVASSVVASGGLSGTRMMLRNNSQPTGLQAHPVQMSTAAGPVHGHVGVQVMNVRRIR